MKVIAVNGSPRAQGNTYTALEAVLGEIKKEGIETEIIHIGNKAIRGCTACNHCVKAKDETCAIANDEVNEVLRELKTADGILLGSPVYFSAIPGTMKSFLDRTFRVANASGCLFRHKVGACVVADRRAGAVPTYNQLNNFINYAEMFMPSSNYWNIVYGTAPGDAVQDIEGLQTMEVLGRNFAWLLKAVLEGKDSLPEYQNKVMFSFIR